MRITRKLKCSFEYKSDKSDRSGPVQTYQQVGLDKGKNVTMYLALISLVTAAIKLGNTVLNLLL